MKWPFQYLLESALPPLENRHKETNVCLQKLSSFTGSNFILTKTFTGRQTGKIRSNVINDFHYNEYGVCLLAKELKKSFFSKANVGNDQLYKMRLMTREIEVNGNNNNA